jgi:hypothetical protein
MNSVEISIAFRSPAEVKHNLDLDHDFYNLTMTYRLDSDFKWTFGAAFDRSTGARIAPDKNVAWKTPDKRFYGRQLLNSMVLYS